MAERSKIEWTDATWNPLRARNRATGKVGHYCVHASEACRNCYSEDWQARFQNPIRFAAQDRAKVDLFLDEKALTQPLRWRRPRRVFVCSMTDLFGDWVEDEWIDRIFAMMALCPQHTFQVLTKRPERMRSWFEEKWQGTPAREVCRIHIPAGKETGRRVRIEEACEPFLDAFGLADPSNEKLWTEAGRCKAMGWDWPLPNVWLGTSVEDQKTADLRIPELLATPASVRWISAEPLLGPVDMHRYLLGVRAGYPAGCQCGHGHGFTRCPNTGGVSQSCHECDCRTFRKAPGKGLHWVVAGGESGRNARPMHPDWPRGIRDQCASAGIPFLLKQIGEWLPWEPDAAPYWKSQNGRVEDKHNLFPADFDADPRWEDGLSFVASDESHATFQRVGKRAAGRLLDGVLHDAFPTNAVRLKS